MHASHSAHIWLLESQINHINIDVQNAIAVRLHLNLFVSFAIFKFMMKKKKTKRVCNVCAAIDFNHLNKSWNSYAMFSFIFHLLIQKNNYPFAVCHLPCAYVRCVLGIYICSALKGNFPPSPPPQRYCCVYVSNALSIPFNRSRICLLFHSHFPSIFEATI